MSDQRHDKHCRELLEEAARWMENNVGMQDAYVDYEGCNDLKKRIADALSAPSHEAAPESICGTHKECVSKCYFPDDCSHRARPSSIVAHPDKSDGVFLCCADGEGSHEFRVCRDRAAVEAFYEEMTGRDQDGTLTSLTSALDDPDDWRNDGTALKIELYCARFYVWKVSAAEVSAPSAIAAPQWQEAPRWSDGFLSLEDSQGYAIVEIFGRKGVRYWDRKLEKWFKLDLPQEMSVTPDGTANTKEKL